MSAQDFLRFLLRWQHVAPGTQLEGKRGLLEAVAQLQGFEAPAVAWERHILPARVADYQGSWLDELCISGDVAWARLSLRKSSGNGNGRAAAASSATPISLARRARPALAGRRHRATATRRRRRSAAPAATIARPPAAAGRALLRRHRRRQRAACPRTSSAASGSWSRAAS